MNTDVLLKWATRSRPALVLERLPLWAADPTVRFLFTVDADDELCSDETFCRSLHEMAGAHASEVRIGHSRSKVEAINDGVAEDDWSGLLILASDDFVPQRPDYAQRIAALFAERFHDGDGVLHLNDGRAGKRLNTLPIMDRKYFDRTGVIYCPEYVSVWCDNEYQDVSESLGRAAYVDEVILHHDWIGQAAPDELHRRNESYYDVDGETYRRRKATGFPAIGATPCPA